MITLLDHEHDIPWGEIILATIGLLSLAIGGLVWALKRKSNGKEESAASQCLGVLKKLQERIEHTESLCDKINEIIGLRDEDGVPKVYVKGALTKALDNNTEASKRVIEALRRIADEEG